MVYLCQISLLIVLLPIQIMLNSFSFATCVDAQQIVIELTFSTASGYFFIIIYVFLIFVIFLVRDAEP